LHPAGIFEEEGFYKEKLQKCNEFFVRLVATQALAAPSGAEHYTFDQPSG
jgi:hypothetical protein